MNLCSFICLSVVVVERPLCFATIVFHHAPVEDNRASDICHLFRFIIVDSYIGFLFLLWWPGQSCNYIRQITL